VVGNVSAGYFTVSIWCCTSMDSETQIRWCV